MPKIVDRSIFVNAVRNTLGEDIEVLTREQVLSVCEKHAISYPAWLTNDPANRAGRGQYRIPAQFSVKKPTVDVPAVSFEPDGADNNISMAPAAIPMRPQLMNSDNSNKNTTSMIPAKATGYVPFGHFNDVRAVIRSGRYYPMYITGLSGNGKTMMVEQVCAVEKRECVRVNITIETDEDDLLGGFRLIDGHTVWHNGPVINAMERGAILLLDEVDLGSNKMMCLQPVLEGKAIYLKKINRLVTPAAGFNIIATANTKGKGSDDGRFIGTNVMNEAFLERFSVTIEQEYPPLKTEAKILCNIIDDTSFVDKLVSWADVIRKSFAEGAVSEIISTRRLVHICEAYHIFNRDREKAINLCLNRFDADTKSSFMDLYKKLDETINPMPQEVVAAATQAQYPF